VDGAAVCQGTTFKFINETAGPNVLHRPHSGEEMALEWVNMSDVSDVIKANN